MLYNTLIHTKELQMQVQIKRELTLTLTEDEIVQLKEFMVKDSETITDYYKYTVVGELWEILNK